MKLYLKNYILIIVFVCLGTIVKAQLDTSNFKSIFSVKTIQTDSIFYTWEQANTKNYQWGKKKYILFYFYSPSSNSCNPNEIRVFNEPSIKELINNHYCPIKITSKDVQFTYLTNKFIVPALPYVIITDTSLNELHRFAGRFDKQKVQAHLQNFIYEKKGIGFYK